MYTCSDVANESKTSAFLYFLSWFFLTFTILLFEKMAGQRSLLLHAFSFSDQYITYIDISTASPADNKDICGKTYRKLFLH